MSAPRATAEFSLYRSVGVYRSLAATGHLDGDMHLADACVEDCLRDCIAASDGSGLSSQLLERECRPICEHFCRESTLPQCDSGLKLCRRLATGQPECCPQNAECCTVFDWNGIIDSQTVCCPPGKVCCHGNGCYFPGEMNCTEFALCTLEQTVCGNQCCDIGERCEPGHGCIPADSVICNDVRCQPGQVCTPVGCCPPNKATSSDCCTSPRVRCGDKCCPDGEDCRAGNVCCTDERWFANAQGGGTCV